MFGWRDRVEGVVVGIATNRGPGQLIRGHGMPCPYGRLIGMRINRRPTAWLRIERRRFVQVVFFKLPARWILDDILAYFVKFVFIADYALEIVALPNARIRSAEDFASTLRNGGFERAYDRGDGTHARHSERFHHFRVTL